MRFVDRISRAWHGFRADVSGTPAPWDDYWYNPLGSASASGMRITADTAKRIGAVLACVGVIGRNLGMMPCKIFTEAPDGSKKVVDHHPLYDVLYSTPNNFQTAFEFKQMMQGHLELRGNAYAEIKPGPRGAVDQLIPMHPDRVIVEQLKPSGRLRYRYNDPLTGTTRILMGAPDSEVFNLRNFSDDGRMGQSTVSMACDVFGVALARQDYSARFLKNDARPPFVFEGTNFRDKEAERRFREAWQEGQTGANRHKGGLLPPGVTIKELGVKPIDAQMLDAMKFSRIDCCSIFGVPPHLIGETEKTATYASVEQFNIMYAVHCILPRLVLWEQAIQRDLLTSAKYFAKFSMAALLRGDTASRFTAYQIAIQNGWMSQDDVRLLEDLNPIPNGEGKTYWRPAAWIPLGQISMPAAPASNALPDDTDTEDPEADGGEGAGDDGQARTGRLQLLASSAAERCTRKEVATLRKLVERDANSYQLEQFYADHLAFVGQVLGLEPDQLSTIRQQHCERAQAVQGFLAAGDKAAAYDYIDRLVVRTTVRLAKLAAEGVL